MVVKNPQSGPVMNPAAKKSSSIGLVGWQQFFGLFVAYLLTGILSGYLNIPSGYASAIWPPSGIALAGILVLGNRVWPAIWTAAFWVNLINGWSFGSSASFHALIFPLATGGGAALQALVGAALVRRFAGYPNQLASEKEVLFFMLFGGLLASLVNATLSVSALVLTERIPGASFPISWVTWWIGDSLGVFVFTPLMLVWMSSNSQVWRERRILVTLPILAMFVLSTLAVLFQAQNENERLKLQFNQQADELRLALTESIFIYLNELHSLQNFYKSSKTIERQEFHSFVSYILAHFSGIKALEWSPRVLDSQRDSFEKNTRREMGIDFQITERQAGQGLIAAQVRTEYFPVTFLEPYQGNEAALGYDLFSDVLRRQGMEFARDHGDIGATQRIRLVQESGDPYGVLVFMPIYYNGLSSDSLEERRQNLAGFVLAVFRGSEIVPMALKDLDQKGLTYRLLDVSAPAEEQLIFSNQNAEKMPFVLQENGLFGRYIALTSSSEIAVGGRRWRFEVSPTQAYFAYHVSANTWLTMLTGLLVTSIVASFVLVLSGRGSILQRLVDERTAALSKSEDIYRATFNHAAVGIARVGLDGRWLEVNQWLCDIVAYSREELLTRGFQDITHPDDLTEDVGLMHQALSGGIPRFNVEKRYLRKTGEIIWANITVALVRSCDGLPNYFITVVEDVSQRKRNEERIYKLSLAVEQSSNMVMIANLDGNIEYVNQAFVNATGYSRDEVANKNPRLLQSGKTPKASFEAMWASLVKGEVWKGELINKRKDGSEYIESALFSPVRQNDGTVTHFLAIKEDITAQKYAEAQMLNLLQEQKAILDSELVGIIKLRGRQFVWINQSFERLTGYSKEVLLGQNTRLLYQNDTEYQDIYREAYLKINNGSAYRSEKQFVCHGGVLRWFEISGCVLSPDNDDTIWTFVEIDDRKRFEAELISARDIAESAARVKSEFLANMSHEIRTPVNAILGLSYLVLDKPLTEEVRDYLEKINTSSESLLGILNDILDFSKIEAGKLMIEYRQFNLHLLLENLHNLFLARAEEKQLEFSVDISSGVPRNLIGDALRIRQILTNMISNAIKFTEQGQVRVDVILQEAGQSHVSVRFSVLDTGIGISPADQLKLFQPFSQLDSSITRRFGGTGLGLEISHKLLNLMGTDFQVESVKGQGTVFSFELQMGIGIMEQLSEINQLPVERKAGMFSSALRKRGEYLTGARILVAEDNRINQQVVSAFLKLSGMQVEIANNGKEALQCLETNRYDAVLMDVHMPEMGGMEATTQIRKLPRFKTLPIIALTAGVTQEERNRCSDAGMNGFIAKPVNPEELIAVLEGLIQQKTYVTMADEKTMVSDIQNLTLPGFDCEAVLSMAGGEIRTVKKLLIMFREDYENFDNKLETLLANHDMLAACQLIHTIKGTAGSVGAIRLAAAAMTLEVSARTGNLDQSAYTDFRTELQETLIVLADVTLE